MNAGQSNVTTLQPGENANVKTTLLPRETFHDVSPGEPDFSRHETAQLERKLVRKVDLRLCSIAGLLCSLNLIDSGIISSASVSAGFFEDLGLGVGNRYVSDDDDDERMSVWWIGLG